LAQIAAVVGACDVEKADMKAAAADAGIQDVT